MTRRNDDTLPAVAARRRGRATLRAATVSVGAAGLVTAGVVAFTLPGSTTASGAAATGTSTPASAKATSGSSSATSKSTSSSATPSPTPSASSGSAQTTSGGS